MVVQAPSWRSERLIRPCVLRRPHLLAVDGEVKRDLLARLVVEDDGELLVGLSHAERASGERVDLEDLSRALQLNCEVPLLRHDRVGSGSATYTYNASAGCKRGHCCRINADR